MPPVSVTRSVLHAVTQCQKHAERRPHIRADPKTVPGTARGKMCLESFYTFGKYRWCYHCTFCRAASHRKSVFSRSSEQRSCSVQPSLNRLVVVPSDPIASYERAGYDWLERYYNPLGAFRE